MRSTPFLLCSIILCLLFTGCRKDDDQYYEGVVVYQSCTTTVVAVTNRDYGVAWTNCHNGARYEHVFEAHVAGTGHVGEGLHPGDKIRFELAPRESFAYCKVMDCVPALTASIILR